MLFETSTVFITITQTIVSITPFLIIPFIILKSVTDEQLVLFLVSMVLSSPEGDQCFYIRTCTYGLFATKCKENTGRKFVKRKASQIKIQRRPMYEGVYMFYLHTSLDTNNE